MISIELSGKERNLRYDYNSVCDLEERANKGIIQLMNEQAGLNVLRLLLWAGLKHENKGLTVDMVGLWIQKYLDDGMSMDALFEKCITALAKSGILGKQKAEE
jgi:hypothetical protein